VGIGRVFLSAWHLQRTNIATKNINDHKLFGNRLIRLFRGLIDLPRCSFRPRCEGHDKDVFVGAD
jgi:hypothetical protein